MDECLIPNVEDAVESKVFYLKMKGDYCRYLAEIEPSDEERGSNALFSLKESVIRAGFGCVDYQEAKNE